MTTVADAWQAGVDAVIADNGLNRGGFADAIRTVITQSFSNSEATDWIDAVAVRYNELGLINNPTYNNLRGDIIGDGATIAMDKFNALSTTLNALPETAIALDAVTLLNLRDDRDNINAALARCDELIAAEPSGTVGRLVKDVLRDGKNSLRQYRESVRTQIQNLTGDPDS